MKTITISIPKETLRFINGVAKKEELSKGYLVKRAIRRYYARPFELSDIPNTDVKTISIRLSDSLNTLLNETALKYELTKSQVVSQIVKRYL